MSQPNGEVRMNWKERQQQANAAMGKKTLEEFGHDMMAGSEERWMGEPVPPEVFTVGTHDLFILLEFCHTCVLEGDWIACFYANWSSFRNDAALREYRILEALDSVYVGKEDVVSEDGTVWSIEERRKIINEHLIEVDNKFFEERDPRWVRVFKGEATPEEEAEVRAIIKQQEEQSRARHLARKSAGKLGEPVDRAEEQRRSLRLKVESLQRRLAELEANT